MRYTHDHADGDRNPFVFQPDAVYDQFGARFGMLATPEVAERYVTQMFSDGPGADSLRPVSLTLRHGVGERVIDVVTRRVEPDATGAIPLAEHMWSGVTDLRLARSDAVPADQLPEWARSIALRPRAAAASPCRGTVDGVERVWDVVRADDLVAYGLHDGDVMIAVIAPADMTAAPAVTTWPPA